MSMKVSFLSAFDSTVNIGGEYNRLISQINDEWIFIKDGDSLFLTSDYGDRISQIIAANDRYDVIGATTNRIGVKELKSQKNMEFETDMNKHIELCNEIWETNKTNVIDTTDTVAAFCMFFKRKVWEQVKFRENAITFDRNFCEDAIKHNYKIGIATGLYVFHLYRWGQLNPQYYTDHLVKNMNGVRNP